MAVRGRKIASLCGESREVPRSIPGGVAALRVWKAEKYALFSLPLVS